MLFIHSFISSSQIVSVGSHDVDGCISVFVYSCMSSASQQNEIHDLAKGEHVENEKNGSKRSSLTNPTSDNVSPGPRASHADIFRSVGEVGF